MLRNGSESSSGAPLPLPLLLPALLGVRPGRGGLRLLLRLDRLALRFLVCDTLLSDLELRDHLTDLEHERLARAHFRIGELAVLTLEFDLSAGRRGAILHVVVSLPPARALARGGTLMRPEYVKSRR